MKKSLKTTKKKKSNLTAKQQLDEWKKCREDHLYFINKYVYIKHPHRGKIRFNTYEFQDEILNLITDNKDTIILKSRQMGISTIMSAYALWLMTFHDDKQIVILANKLSGAKNVIKKVKYGYRNLPEFLQEKLAVDNKAEFGFTNDSEVIALASNGDAGRGEGASLLIFDECNFSNTKIKIRHIYNKKEQILSIGDLFEGSVLNEKSQKKLKGSVKQGKLNFEIKNINDYEIWNGTEWCKFSGVMKKDIEGTVEIFLSDGSKLEGSKNHKVEVSINSFKRLDSLNVGDKVNNLIIENILYNNETKEMYDILDVENGNKYKTNNVISHNCAFVPKNIAEEIWSSVYPTLATGGKSILLSTPKGSGKNFFYEKWKGCSLENRTNEFAGYKLLWNLHPDRTQVWRDAQTKQLGELLAKQENDCVFLSEDNAIVNPLLLEEFLKNLPDYETDDTNYLYESIWYFKKPEEGRIYVAGIDTARGDGSDSSAISIFDGDTFEQVCEFNSQCSTSDLVKVATYLGYMYNEALLIPESNGLGWSTVQGLIDVEYPNLYYSIKDMPIYDMKKILRLGWDNIDQDKKTPGFSTTPITRPNLLNKFIKDFENKVLKINSKRLLNELKDFVWKKGRYDHADGAHDDCIFASAIAYYVFSTWGMILREGMEMTKQQILGFGKNTAKDNYNKEYVQGTKQLSAVKSLDDFFNNMN